MIEPQPFRDRAFMQRPPLWLATFALVSGIALPAAADPAAGEALFREGRRLFDQGKIAEACAKFADSQALDASSGTLLNLADCHEEQGKTATAWAEFLAAAELAQMQRKRQHESEAVRRANALEPKLSYLTIEVAAQHAGLEVLKDGQLLPAGVLGTRIPVDPGEHVLEATAPGYTPVRLSITVGPAGDQRRAVLPALTAQPAEKAPKAAPPVVAARAGAHRRQRSAPALPSRPTVPARLRASCLG